MTKFNIIAYTTKLQTNAIQAFCQDNNINANIQVCKKFPLKNFIPLIFGYGSKLINSDCIIVDKNVLLTFLISMYCKKNKIPCMLVNSNTLKKSILNFIFSTYKNKTLKQVFD